MHFVTISISEQHKSLQKKFQECLNLSSFMAEATPDICPYDFDQVMCWPPTRSGELAIQPCPLYINGLRIRGKASRQCIEPGYWRNYTNYENCINKKQVMIASMNHLGHVGYGLSLLFLGISVIVMTRFKKLSCPRNTIHLHVFYAFLLRALTHFVILIVPANVIWLCRLFAAIDYFSITASHTWVFIEALFLHNTLLLHLMRDTPYTLGIYISIGWISPCMLGVVWSTLKYVYGNRECWQINDDPYKRVYWLELLYPILTTLLNLALFINIIRVLFLKATDRSNGLVSNRYRTLFKATAILVIVFGIYDVVLIPLVLLSEQINSESFEIVQLYYEHTMTSCQGFFVALLFCFINSEVIKEVKRYYRQRTDRRACLNEHSMPMSVIFCDRKYTQTRPNKRATNCLITNTGINNPELIINNDA